MLSLHCLSVRRRTVAQAALARAAIGFGISPTMAVPSDYDFGGVLRRRMPDAPIYALRTGLSLPRSVPNDLTQITPFTRHEQLAWRENRRVRARFVEQFRSSGAILSFGHRRALLTVLAVAFAGWTVGGRVLPDEIVGVILIMAGPNPHLRIRLPPRHGPEFFTGQFSVFWGLRRALFDWTPGALHALRVALAEERDWLNRAADAMEATRWQLVTAAERADAVWERVLQLRLPMFMAMEQGLELSITFRG